MKRYQNSGDVIVTSDPAIGVLRFNGTSKTILSISTVKNAMVFSGAEEIDEFFAVIKQLSIDWDDALAGWAGEDQHDASREPDGSEGYEHAVGPAEFLTKEFDTPMADSDAYDPPDCDLF